MSELTPVPASPRELVVQVAKEGRRRIVPLAILFALVALVALAVGEYWPKKYVSSTTILVEESNIIKPLMEGRAVPTGVADRAGMAREVVFSNRILSEILKAGGWDEAELTPVDRDRIAERIKQRTQVDSPRENLIRITYTDSVPERALKVTQKFAELFIAESLAAKERESREAFEFIAGRVEEYRAKLTSAEENLKAYRSSNPDSLPGSEADVNARIGELRRQVEAARLDAMDLSSRAGLLQSQLSGESEITSVQTRAGQIRARMAELQTELDKLLMRYTENHPDVVRARHQMEDLQRDLASAEAAGNLPGAAASALNANVEFNPLYQELKSTLAETNRMIAATNARMSASQTLLDQELKRGQRIAESESRLAELTRDYEVNRDIYQDLLKRRENARVSMNLDEEKRGLTFSIQDPATLPLRPSGIRFIHFAIAGLAAACALPLVALWGLLQVDRRVRSGDQLQRLSSLPVLVSVPEYLTRRDTGRRRLRYATAALVVAGVAVAYAAAGWSHWSKLAS